MDREKLRQLILKVRDWRDYNFNEDQVKKSIIEPIFNNLGWDTADPDQVKVEYPLSPEGKVDYAFFANSGLLILVEAKAANKPLEGYENQLLKNGFSTGGVKLAVLTNGLEWWLYLPSDVEKNWNERKFYSVDLAKQDVETICDMLNRFLGKENVLSGDAVREANYIGSA